MPSSAATASTPDVGERARERRRRGLLRSGLVGLGRARQPRDARRGRPGAARAGPAPGGRDRRRPALRLPGGPARPPRRHDPLADRDDVRLAGGRRPRVRAGARDAPAGPGPVRRHGAGASTRTGRATTGCSGGCTRPSPTRSWRATRRSPGRSPAAPDRYVREWATAGRARRDAGGAPQRRRAALDDGRLPRRARAQRGAPRGSSSSSGRRRCRRRPPRATRCSSPAPCRRSARSTAGCSACRRPACACRAPRRRRLLRTLRVVLGEGPPAEAAARRRIGRDPDAA